MKKIHSILLSLSALLMFNAAQAQSNTFPASGSVGIGTLSPQQRLHVEGSSNQAIFVNTSALGPISGSGQIGYVKALPTAAGHRLGYFLTGSRGGAQNNFNVAGMIGYAGGAWTAGVSHPAYLAFETTPSGATSRVERLRIAPNGNVGIGTTTPAFLLDVADRIRLRSGASGSAGLWLNNLGNTGEVGFVGVANNNHFGLWGNTGAGWSVAVNTSNGHVGIGNVSPAYRLDVSGRMRLRSGGGTAGLWLNNSANTGEIGFIGALNDNHIGLYGSGSGWSLLMNIATGNVGIGNAAPTQKLHVTTTNSSGATAAIIQNLSGATFNDVLTLQGGTNGGSGSWFTVFRRPDNQLIGTISQATATSVAYNTTSDKRLKADIRATRYGLADVQKIEVRDYKFKDDNVEQTGFIAQQLYEIYPEAVAVGGDDPKTRPWMVDYGRVTPLLVKAIQEQQEEIDQLKQELTELKQMIAGLNGSGGALSLSRGKLGIVTPNPARGTARIQYELPDGAANARLLLTDALGRTVRTVQLNTSGVIDVDVSALSSGVYNYSLIVGGKTIQTKKMTVQK